MILVGLGWEVGLLQHPVLRGVPLEVMCPLLPPPALPLAVWLVLTCEIPVKNTHSLLKKKKKKRLGKNIFDRNIKKKKKVEKLV